MGFYIVTLHPQTGKPMGFVYEDETNETPKEFPTEEAAEECMKGHPMENHNEILEF